MSHRYLISDKDHNPIAQAELTSAPETEPLHLNVLNGHAERVAEAIDVCLIAMYDEDLTFRGRVGYRYGDCVVIQPLERRGQRGFICKDLSCGGIAFQTAQPLDVGEIIQVVIAPMPQPLLVQAQILRPLPSKPGDEPTYASKFVDLCDDEDAMLRKTVFSLQLEGR